MRSSLLLSPLCPKCCGCIRNSPCLKRKRRVMQRPVRSQSARGEQAAPPSHGTCVALRLACATPSGHKGSSDMSGRVKSCACCRLRNRGAARQLDGVQRQVSVTRIQLVLKYAKPFEITWNANPDSSENRIQQVHFRALTSNV